MVDSRGLEPRKLARSDWFTASCNCRYTNHPLKLWEPTGHSPAPSYESASGYRKRSIYLELRSREIGASPRTRTLTRPLKRRLCYVDTSNARKIGGLPEIRTRTKLLKRELCNRNTCGPLLNCKDVTVAPVGCTLRASGGSCMLLTDDPGYSFCDSTPGGVV